MEWRPLMPAGALLSRLWPPWFAHKKGCYEPWSDAHLSPDDAIGRPSVLRTASTQVVGFLLIPNFSLMSYASAIEPFRSANRMSGRPLYDWRHISIDGAPVAASNGVSIAPDHAIRDAFVPDMLFVCAGG